MSGKNWAILGCNRYEKTKKTAVIKVPVANDKWSIIRGKNTISVVTWYLEDPEKHI